MATADGSIDPTDTLRQDVTALRKDVTELRQDVEALLQALANFALIEDRHPTHTDPNYDQNASVTKFTTLSGLMQRAGPDAAEPMYMLATYCFDLARRFAFLNSAITVELPARVRAREKLKAEVKRDDDELNGPVTASGGEWQQRAATAGKQLRAWHRTANKLPKDELRERFV
jgi:hypothetical protein